MVILQGWNWRGCRGSCFVLTISLLSESIDTSSYEVDPDYKCK